MDQVVANVTVVFCVAACIAGGIFAWWIENRPGSEADDPKEEAEKEDAEKEDAEKENAENDGEEKGRRQI